MKLPSDSDYQAALQDPRRAFADPELREAVPELVEKGAMAGLPRPRAGNFATVYKLRHGERAFAVRCFTRPPQEDQALRYGEIIKHLSARRLPFAVDVAWLSQGIQVRGRWFPIVKMEWVQGESLERHVERNLSSPSALFELACAWVELQRDLRGARMAHGDLQHGNVVVTPAGLRLVDYDGMFVPSLLGCRAYERGHANYQHPRRDAGFFDGGLDHFSAWVVWASLVALAHEPQLWARFKGGDDCLLFRQKDFIERYSSPLLRALLGSPHEPVRAVASTLDSFLDRPPAEVPPLEGPSLAGILLPETAALLRALAASTGRAASRDEGRVKALAPPSVARDVVRFFAPAPAHRRVFTVPPPTERVVATGFVLLAFAALFMAMVRSPLWLGGLGLTGGLTWAWLQSSYRRHGSHPRSLDLQRTVEWTERKLQEAEGRLQGLLTARDSRDREARLQREALAAREEALRREREEAFHQLREVHQAELSRFAERRLVLDRREHAAYEELGKEQRERMAGFARELASFASLDTALAAALQQHQDKYVTEVLRDRAVVNANFRGLDTSFKMRNRLSQAGIITAADVSREHLKTVRKLGAGQLSVLLHWRDSLEQEARATMPKALPAKEEASVRDTWAARKAWLEQEREQVRKQFEQRAADLAVGFAELARALKAEEEAATEALWREQPARVAAFDQESQRLAEARAAWARGGAAANEELTAARADCARLRWAHEEAARELAVYAPSRFGRYVLMVFHHTHDPSTRP